MKTVKLLWNWLEPWLTLGGLVLLFRALLHEHGWSLVWDFAWFCLFVNYFRNKIVVWHRQVLMLDLITWVTNLEYQLKDQTKELKMAQLLKETL
jgi:hypothetical protein